MSFLDDIGQLLGFGSNDGTVSPTGSDASPLPPPRPADLGSQPPATPVAALGPTLVAPPQSGIAALVGNGKDPFAPTPEMRDQANNALLLQFGGKMLAAGQRGQLGDRGRILAGIGDIDPNAGLLKAAQSRSAQIDSAMKLQQLRQQQFALDRKQDYFSALKRLSEGTTPQVGAPAPQGAPVAAPDTVGAPVNLHPTVQGDPAPTDPGTEPVNAYTGGPTALNRVPAPAGTPAPVSAVIPAPVQGGSVVQSPQAVVAAPASGLGMLFQQMTGRVPNPTELANFGYKMSTDPDGTIKEYEASKIKQQEEAVKIAGEKQARMQENQARLAQENQNSLGQTTARLQQENQNNLGQTTARLNQEQSIKAGNETVKTVPYGPGQMLATNGLGHQSIIGSEPDFIKSQHTDVKTKLDNAVQSQQNITDSNGVINSLDSVFAGPGGGFKQFLANNANQVMKYIPGMDQSTMQQALQGDVTATNAVQAQLAKMLTQRIKSAYAGGGGRILASEFDQGKTWAGGDINSQDIPSIKYMLGRLNQGDALNISEYMGDRKDLIGNYDNADPGLKKSVVGRYKEITTPDFQSFDLQGNPIGQGAAPPLNGNPAPVVARTPPAQPTPTGPAGIPPPGTPNQGTGVPPSIPAGTIHTFGDGVKRYSAIENGKMVWKPLASNK